MITNREWLMEQMQNMSDEEFAETIHTPDGAVSKYACRDCIYPQLRECKVCVVGWLKAEHKEPIKLSDAERVILENVDKEFVAIGKNMSGEMFFLKKNGDKYWSSIFAPEMFKFIKENYEPYNIEELLKGE